MSAILGTATLLVLKQATMGTRPHTGDFLPVVLMVPEQVPPQDRKLSRWTLAMDLVLLAPGEAIG